MYELSFATKLTCCLKNILEVILKLYNLLAIKLFSP